ncbi:hypothetical protein ASG56_21015 [Rhodococcus sp. Leaf7]|uniref:hypothetical protein n=1 Tax=unclassified Rhodococcus (in: high G+C Gram-positive bacteria) TaxID=192944 RepID=UPI0006FDC18A|nr:MULTISPECIES: hypothetical protein [unclassified Rhodococcus (in: high G+C Gram-positive bacteria)]KQU01782.1 hypothetical protein ASG56_21015 [Rhodococcus sp. Leaf7]KQU36754.1 hypothetical protein ASG64_20990 [Rhodococcus sp. Leaf247]
MSNTPKKSARGRGDTTVVSAVLLYDLDGSTVTATLLSPVDGSELGAAESIHLDSFSPEQIGLTVPILWDLVDVAEANVMCVVTSGAAADIDVAPPILELAFGVPVFGSATPPPSSDEVAPVKPAVARSTSPVRPVPAVPIRRSSATTARPAPSLVKKSGVAAAAAAAAAARPAATEPEVVPAPAVEDRPTVHDTDTEVFPAVVLPEVAVQHDDAPTESFLVVPTAAAVAAPRRSRRAVGFAGAAAAAVLVAAGIGTAAVISGGSDSAPQNTAATQQAPDSAPTVDSPALAAAAPAPAAPPVAPPAAPAEPLPTDAADAPAAAPDWTAPAAAAPAPWTAATPAPTSWTSPSSSQSPSAVPPPQFTVPVPENDPSKSRQQLQDEAWAKHWAETGQWLNQEFPQ